MTVSVAWFHLSNPLPTTFISDWRMQLNNFLQVNGGVGRLRYVDLPSGPAHKPTWHCTTYSKSPLTLCGAHSDIRQSMVSLMPLGLATRRVKRVRTLPASAIRSCAPSDFPTPVPIPPPHGSVGQAFCN